MLAAEQALRDGDLAKALVQLQDAVRNDPSNAKYRTFLFQLLCVTGDWKRALTQLNVVAEMDAAALPMAQTYREAIGCEAVRAEVFAGKRTPMVLGEPDQWMALLVQALPLTAAGKHAEARRLRDEAFEQAPATSGTVDDASFEWIADADGRLGPVLEAVVNGRYYWIPFHRIARIEIDKPEDLRDVVWMPAHFRWSNGGESVGLIPTRYSGSESAEDSKVRLSRKTEWSEASEGVYVGVGQRMLATSGDEFPLMNVRSVVLHTETGSADGNGTGPEHG